MNKPIILKSARPITVGVISDTHIPDRVNDLHPSLLGELSERGVDYILHAGDISQKSVIEQLREIAPVFSVAGNRDFLQGKSLALSQTFIINDVRTVLLHGHINSYTYWMDKIQYVFGGYNLARYTSRFPQVDPLAEVYIFGHTHHPENHRERGKLFFNPGSVSTGDLPDYHLTYGILSFTPSGEVCAGHVELLGAHISGGKWEKTPEKRPIKTK